MLSMDHINGNSIIIVIYFYLEKKTEGITNVMLNDRPNK